MFTDWITSQVGDDPELVAKVVPDYPATGKRTLQDNGSWLRHADPGQRRAGPDRRSTTSSPTPWSPSTASATRPTSSSTPPASRPPGCCAPWRSPAATASTCARCGASGRPPTSGITVPGFPNFFCMYGPGTNLAHGGSLIFHSECQMRYITQCLDELIDGGHRSMEPTPGALRRLARAVPAARSRTWCGRSPSIKHSFFKNADGEIHMLSPWRLVDYWAWTKEPDLGDFVLA